MLEFKNLKKIPVKDKHGEITGWKIEIIRKRGKEKYIIKLSKSGEIYGYEQISYGKGNAVMQERYFSGSSKEERKKKYKYAETGNIKETEEHYYDENGKNINITRYNEHGKPVTVKIYSFDDGEKYLEEGKKYHYSNNELVFVETLYK